MKNPVLVIMAAGMGSRFGGPKQITPVDDKGHIIIDFSLYDAWRAGFRDVAFIIKKEMEAEFRECIGDRMEKYFNVSYIYQDLNRLPEGYEAHVAPRSSTFKNFGVIQTNSVGVIDNSYCGEEDEWRMAAYALRDTVIRKNDRICQFRIVEKQPGLNFIEVERLDDTDRGGFGSTGVE